MKDCPSCDYTSDADCCNRQEKEMDKVDESISATLRRRYKGMREEGYNEQWCRALTRAADQIDALVAACNAAEQCIGELPPTQSRVETMQMIQAALATAK